MDWIELVLQRAVIAVFIGIGLLVALAVVLLAFAVHWIVGIIVGYLAVIAIVAMWGTYRQEVNQER